MPAYEIVDHTFDVVVVRRGRRRPARDLGMRHAGPEDRLHHQSLSHPQPYRGGARRRRRRLGNMGEDDWRWHMYDTVKGSDWLGDQDLIEYLCRNAPEAVYELEISACPSRTEDGKSISAPLAA